MLKIIVCWNRENMSSLTHRYLKDNYTANTTGSTLEKGNDRIRIITQLQTKNILSALNPDEVRFELIPDAYELDLAIARAKAKKGRVYIQGRKVHDYKEDQEESPD